MAVEEKKPTAEETRAMQADQASRESDFAKKLITQFDLPTSLQEAIESHEEGKGKKEAEKEAEADDAEEENTDTDQADTEETTEEESSEENTEESETGDDEDAESDSDGDEADPKTKEAMQKRINELTAKNKRLEARLNAKSNGAEETPTESKDPDTARLEKMSEAQLEQLMDEIEAARDEALVKGDAEKATALRALSKKAGKALQTAPQRFEKTQLNAFYTAVRETESEYGEKFTQATAEKVFAEAKKIFAGSKVYRAHPDGQAEAWRQAVAKVMEISKLSAGKSKAVETERKLNTLKKKVSLDTAVQKGNTKVADEAKLRKKAIHGTSDDKAEFIRKKFNTDSLIPEEYRS